MSYIKGFRPINKDGFNGIVFYRGGKPRRIWGESPIGMGIWQCWPGSNVLNEIRLIKAKEELDKALTEELKIHLRAISRRKK
jgi:hypothetical protein